MSSRSTLNTTRSLYARFFSQHSIQAVFNLGLAIPISYSSVKQLRIKLIELMIYIDIYAKLYIFIRDV